MVTYIDFSSKHDQWIENPDGSLSRMDEPYFEVEKVRENTWKIFSSGDFSYLVAGDAKAIAIDTGYGAGNIRAFMQSLIDRPLSEVINTHDHFDHTANNGYFDRAYMGEKSIPLATTPFPSFAGIDFPRDYERVAVHAGDLFDLGGRTLEVLELADHAVGSILLLDSKERILFTGDEVMGTEKRLNGGVRHFYEGLRAVMEKRTQFDLLCGGPAIFDADVLDRLYQCAKSILDGNEGEPLTEESREAQEPTRSRSDGKIVYQRQAPHPEDMHKDAEHEDGRYRRRAVCAGASIEYDIRLVNQ